MSDQSSRVHRRRRSRSDWKQLVARYEHSGVSRQAFCEQASIPVSSLDYWAVARQRALYQHEEAIADEQLDAQHKLERRVERCKPVVDAFFEWCDEKLQDASLLPTNPFTQALGYVLQRRTELSVFL